LNSSWVKSIHIACKSLDLDDEAYRAILAGHAGVSSSTEIITRIQYDKVMEAFAALGYLPSRASLYATRWGSTLPSQQRKVLALWAKKGRDQNEKALKAFIHRIAGVDDPRFLTQEGISKVIVALSHMKDA